MSDYTVKRLKRVQNSVAKIVKVKRCKVDALKTFEELHWLTISYRIDYKIAAITHKILIIDQSSTGLSEITITPSVICEIS